MLKRITKNQEKEIIRLYKQYSSKVVSDIIGVSVSSVLRVLRRNGIETRPKVPIKPANKFDPDKEREIVRLYTEERKNTVEIANIYNTYNTSIRRVLLRNNIKLRTTGEVLRSVELSDLSSKEGTADFDYFLGLLATDGCVTGNAVVLDFSEANKELLNYWNEFLGNKCNIRCSIHKIYKVPQYRIAFKNRDIVNYLSSFGIIPRKTFNLKLKYINWNVLRGIIDGDGCISLTNKGKTIRLSITSACKDFLIQIQKFLQKEGLKSFIREVTRNENPVFDLSVYKTFDLLKIYKYLYNNAHYFLKRKKEKFGPILEKSNI